MCSTFRFPIRKPECQKSSFSPMFTENERFVQTGGKTIPPVMDMSREKKVYRAGGGDANGQMLGRIVTVMYGCADSAKAIKEKYRNHKFRNETGSGPGNMRARAFLCSKRLLVLVFRCFTCRFPNDQFCLQNNRRIVCPFLILLDNGIHCPDSDILR